MTIKISPYTEEHERGWLHCRVLSFLQTQYYRDVYQKKEEYGGDSIELLAMENKQVIGLIDIEIESSAGEICSNGDSISAMLWHIAVHPDHQRKGVGELLLKAALDKLEETQVKRLEAWTKEDEFVRKWYFKNDFKIFQSYHHVQIKGEEVKLKNPVKGLSIQDAFGHFIGDDIDSIKSSANKIEECIGLEKWL